MHPSIAQCITSQERILAHTHPATDEIRKKQNLIPLPFAPRYIGKLDASNTFAAIEGTHPTSIVITA
ncbi:hypothetical protein [Pseudomonas sp. RL_5y_Pfl2_69]|uniref:hypothetical protein n=1 Tax=Pseudomonas sp. RL_5y_Pfl2_69 TaxID=3088711 RepID=UPI0030D8FD1D